MPDFQAPLITFNKGYQSYEEGSQGTICVYFNTVEACIYSSILIFINSQKKLAERHLFQKKS